MEGNVFVRRGLLNIVSEQRTWEFELIFSSCAKRDRFMNYTVDIQNYFGSRMVSVLFKISSVYE